MVADAHPVETQRVDVAVIGGGPVGAAAALALQAAGLNLLLIEARPAATPATDLRPLALSYGSRLILERLKVWDALEPATPIERIHVSQRGGFGRAMLSAAEARVPALGYVVDYAGLVGTLESTIARSGLRVARGAQVRSIAHGPESARIEFESATGTCECFASVVAVADGAALAGAVEVRSVDYTQSAVTARVETDTAHGHTAFERFTSDGPIALLPYDRSYALVWTVAAHQAEALSSAEPGDFLARLQAAFGERVGRFAAVHARAPHRVALRMAKDITAGRAVLIGNAAQTLHPVAGQGFNLGLRDAWELATEIRRRGPRDEGLAAAYRARRRVDRTGGIGFTHTLVKLFSNDWLALELARGAGLTLLDCLPPAKDFVMRRMIFGARG